MADATDVDGVENATVSVRHCISFLPSRSNDGAQHTLPPTLTLSCVSSSQLVSAQQQHL